MKALTVIAATVYAVTLWMFAPESVWRREVEQAKRNQQTRLNPQPEITPQPKPEPMSVPESELKSTQKAIPESIPQLDVTPEPQALIHPITESQIIESEASAQPEQTPTTPEQSIQTLGETVYTEWTTAKLRDEAKRRKLNWRPLINGKRTPLKKPDLIELLTT
ncbi:MAG TPA: hypothetical protein V6D21_04875 [Candidatus Obscuribacterales bacterium]